MTGQIEPGGGEVAESTPPPTRRHQRGDGPLLGVWRFVRSGVRLVGLVVLAGNASAHGGVGGGAIPVTFAVVVGLPVVAGLVGGSAAIRSRRRARQFEQHVHTSVVLGLVLVVLGVTFVLAAIPRGLPVTIGGVAVGGVLAGWIARRGPTGSGCTAHAHLTFAAVFAHRVLEGVVLGALYTTGTVVGLVGAVGIAGHTALETAAVGGLFATHSDRARRAVVLVQVGFVVGAGLGLIVAATIPPTVRHVALALAGGVLLVTGAIETMRSVGSGRRSRSRESETRADAEGR